MNAKVRLQMKIHRPFVLVVDPDVRFQSVVKDSLSFDFDVHTVSDMEQAAVQISTSEAKVDLVLCSLPANSAGDYPWRNELGKYASGIPVVVLSVFGGLASAANAMRQGASDYVLKSGGVQELRSAISRALQNTATAKPLLAPSNELIGQSQSISRVRDLLKRVAPSQANVLITGETGTGKEVVARAIHSLSGRSRQPFIPINCSAIPAELLESELFGHVKGAFTGALNNRKGLFEEAQGGTVFLDEIGDMEISLQAKLLRVVQERKIKPVGGSAFKDIDVRILSATHRNLREAIHEGQFREDLFYRLCVIHVELPALRNRKEDIPLLVDHFVKKQVAVNGLKSNGFTTQAMERMMAHPWEGNIRELENFVERSMVVCDSEWISEDQLSFEESSRTAASTTMDQPIENLTLREVEKRHIRLILGRKGMCKDKAAQILGINRKTLYRKEREFGLAQRTSQEGAQMELSKSW